MAILMAQPARSEAQIWSARTEQARRIAAMLSPSDTEKALAYANECDEKCSARLARNVTSAGTSQSNDPRLVDIALSFSHHRVAA